MSAGPDIGQDGISVAVGWSFIQLVVPDQASAEQYPVLAAFAANAEQLDIFSSLPMV